MIRDKYDRLTVKPERERAPYDSFLELPTEECSIISAWTQKYETHCAKK
jgi:hypothetical protein